MSARAVQVWFQNRRQSLRRQTQEAERRARRQADRRPANPAASASVPAAPSSMQHPRPAMPSAEKSSILCPPTASPRENIAAQQLYRRMSSSLLSRYASVPRGFASLSDNPLETLFATPSLSAELTMPVFAVSSVTSPDQSNVPDNRPYAQQKLPVSTLISPAPRPSTSIRDNRRSTSPYHRSPRRLSTANERSSSEQL